MFLCVPRREERLLPFEGSLTSGPLFRMRTNEFAVWTLASSFECSWMRASEKILSVCMQTHARLKVVVVHNYTCSAHGNENMRFAFEIARLNVCAIAFESASESQKRWAPKSIFAMSQDQLSLQSIHNQYICTCTNCHFALVRLQELDTYAYVRIATLNLHLFDCRNYTRMYMYELPLCMHLFDCRN